MSNINFVSLKRTAQRYERKQAHGHLTNYSKSAGKVLHSHESMGTRSGYPRSLWFSSSLLYFIICSQVDQTAMMGRILDQLAMCRLQNEVVLPTEVHEQSPTPTWTVARVNTNMTSEIQEFEGNNERHVSNTLDEALRQLKLANDFPGKYLKLENLLQQIIPFGILKMPTI